MSHVATISVEIKDLDALDAACKRIGCTLVRGQRTYAWYGHHVGDYPLPEGFAASDLGKCEHAIKVPGVNYEVGVVPRRDGRQGHTLIWDFWGGQLTRWLGPNAQRLVQAYGIEAAKKAARLQGYAVTETTKPNGAVVLQLRGS